MCLSSQAWEVETQGALQLAESSGSLQFVTEPD